MTAASAISLAFMASLALASVLLVARMAFLRALGAKISPWALAWVLTALAMFVQWGRAEWNHSLFLQWQAAYWRDVGGIAEPARQSQPEAQ